MSQYTDEEIYEDAGNTENENRENYDDDNEVSPAPAWIISLAVHGLLALIMVGIIFGQMQEDEPPPIRLSLPDDPIAVDPPEDPIPDVATVEITVDVKELTEIPVVEKLDIEVEVMEIEDPVDNEDVAENRPDAVSVSEMGGSMAFMAIGVSGGSAGKLGRRGKGRKAAAGKFGGSRASETSVNAALRWFKKHQTVDGEDKGMWDVDGYMDNCQEGIKCEPGTAHTTAGGDGDTACTAYAVLCFLGGGYDHRTPSIFKSTVTMGIEWLKENQNDDGSFGTKKRNYENAVATMALCEAYAMTADPALKQSAQKAVDNLLARQGTTDTHLYGLAWDYTKPNPARADSSVSGWAVMALKAAKLGGLDVGNGWKGAQTWLDLAWMASNPGLEANDIGSDSRSTFCYTYDAIADVAKGKKLESVGALCAIFLGKRKGDGMLESLINTIMATQVPKEYPTNTYDMYYNTLNMFQYGGEKWQEWNAQVRDLLVDAQHGKDSGCFYGSWDFEGTKFHGHETGRLLSTAYCTLSLEVYYRYDRVLEMEERLKRKHKRN